MVYSLKSDKIKIFENKDKLFVNAADDFYVRVKNIIEKKGKVSVVLSGGNTPIAFFDAIVANEKEAKSIDWSKIEFYFGDERFVPSSDIRNNYHTAYAHLFSKVPVDPKKIHRIPTESQTPQIAAEKYEQTIRTAMNLKSHECPKFDIVYLGLGDDAHTASLMPHSDIVTRYAHNYMKDESPQLVAELFIPAQNMYRITLTPNAINCSKNIVFLVTGADKAHAVWEVIDGDLNPAQYPAQLIHCVHKETNWYLDQAASSKII